MKKLVFSAALLCGVCRGQGGLHQSQSALMASTFADAMSSRGLVELNPILGRSNFRLSNQGLKSVSISVGVVVAEALIVRKWPSTAKAFRYTNWLASGLHVATAIHNERIR